MRKGLEVEVEGEEEEVEGVEVLVAVLVEVGVQAGVLLELRPPREPRGAAPTRPPGQGGE